MNFSHHHRFLPGTGDSAPPLLLLHGTGGTENDLIPLAQRLSPGSALLSPRGNVLEQGQARFFRRFAEGVFDLDDVRRRAGELADFLASATTHYGLDTARMIALGFSNGANMAASLLLLRPESLAGAILLRPMIVLEPTDLSGLGGKRVLINAGSDDPIVPAGDPERLAALLRRGGAQVTLHSHPAGHGLTQADLGFARQFLTPH